MIFNHSIKITLFSLSLLLLGGCAAGNHASSVAWPKVERANAHVALGMNYLQRGSLAIARERFEKALDANPRSSEAYHGLGLIEAKSLNLSLASDYMAKALKLDSSNFNAASDHAVILCEMGEASRGLRLLENTHLPSNAPQLNIKLALGRCYEANNEIGKAESAYAEVLDENPTISQALLSMSHLKFNAKEYLSARGFVQRYFSTNTISSDALLLAANIEEKLNNRVERDKYTLQLWRRYPKSKHANQARELFSQ